jgi:hypothetical protein
MIVMLGEGEINFLRELAKKRNAKEKAYGACTYGGKQGGCMAHYIGLVGEYAVTKSIGVQVDERIFEDHGDDGVDFDSVLCGKWGVKTTTYTIDPYLRVEKHHFSEEVRGYVLCAYNMQKNIQKVEIVGWAFKDDVKQAEQRVLRRGGPLNYILEKTQLKDWNIFPCSK